MQVGGWSRRTGTGGPVWHLPSGAGSGDSNGVGYTDAALGDPSLDYGDVLTAMNSGTPGAGSFSKPITAAEFGRGLFDMFVQAPINLLPGLASEVANGYVGLYNIAAGNGPQVGTFDWRPLGYSDPMAGALGEFALGIAAPEIAAGAAAQLNALAPEVRGNPFLGDLARSTGGADAAAATSYVRTAAQVNSEMVAVGNQPAWLNGTSVTTRVDPVGTRYQMVVSEGQAQALMRGQSAFGGFATPDAVTSQAFARNDLVILEEFKSDVSRVVTVEVSAPQAVNSGWVGPLGKYAGGAQQVEFLGPRNLKLVGEPNILPLN
jgi:hypothetical protein